MRVRVYGLICLSDFYRFAPSTERELPANHSPAEAAAIDRGRGTPTYRASVPADGA